MTTPQNEQPDWQLRTALRQADPAADLRPADPTWLAEARDRAVSTPRETHRRASAPRRRWLLVPAGAAAATMTVVAAVGLSTPQAVTALQLDPGAGGPAAICAPVSAEALRQADTAFRAEVVSLDTGPDGRATLTVDRTYKGDVEKRVTVPYRPDLMIEMSLGPLTVGTSVLVAVDDGTVRTCGQSGPVSPELTAIYDQAFG